MVSVDFLLTLTIVFLDMRSEPNEAPKLMSELEKQLDKESIIVLNDVHWMEMTCTVNKTYLFQYALSCLSGLHHDFS